MQKTEIKGATRREALAGGMGLAAFMLADSARGQSVPATRQSNDKPLFEPTTAYTPQEMDGWQVRVNTRFQREHPALCRDAMRLLDSHLYRITRVVPTAALPLLRHVPLWLEFHEGHHPAAVYHPSAQWLREHDMNPEKARCVEIADATNFLNWDRDQPWMVLHELAHSYHDQTLRFDNADVKAAYDHAVASKSYESVLRISGQHEKHYALTNPQEYFAELSESYFGTNDFYPFVRPELREHDPQGFAMIEKMWRVRS